MRIVFTDPALADLEDVYAYLSSHYPTLIAAIGEQFDMAYVRIRSWPESAPVTIIDGRKVRVVTLTKYPYKIFYRVGADFIEVLHIYHSARREFFK